MCKKAKVMISFLVIILLLPICYIKVEAKVSNINSSNLDKGYIEITYKADSKKAIKVQISKDNVKYNYDLGENNRFPLQSGNGKYTISILEHISGTSYKVIEQDTVLLSLSDDNYVYMNSIQLIHWNDDMKVIKLAKKITKDSKTDMDKLKAIYKYVVTSIDYDRKKADNVKSGYIPNIELINKNEKGICYDYSAMLAAMLRSVSVPTKLHMGYITTSSAYHAWNEVYLADENKWVIIDTTTDASNNKIDGSIVNLKQEKNYIISKTY
jgi:transglutaminase-like putative cysteine protease